MKIGVVIDVQGYAVGALDRVDEDVKVDEALRVGIDDGDEAGEVEACAYLFEIELDFDQRKAAGVASDGQLPDETAKGVVLVVVGVEDVGAHLLQKLRGGDAVVGDATDGDEVDGVADEDLVFDQRLPGGGNADDDVFLAG